MSMRMLGTMIEFIFIIYGTHFTPSSIAIEHCYFKDSHGRKKCSSKMLCKGYFFF